jgi:hypothetical protein
VQARREAILNDTREDDEPSEDSHSSEEDEKRRNKRTEMKEFLRSVERAGGRTSEK